MNPIFLEVDEVLDLHQKCIERFGGIAGIRDHHLLLSALAMPQAGFGDTYYHEDLFAMAAAYLFHLARNHPFLDGNKRTAAAAAITFLAMNGLELKADETRLEALVRNVAEGKADKHAVAEFFRRSPCKKS